MKLKVILVGFLVIGTLMTMTVFAQEAVSTSTLTVTPAPPCPQPGLVRPYFVNHRSAIADLRLLNIAAALYPGCDTTIQVTNDQTGAVEFTATCSAEGSCD